MCACVWCFMCVFHALVTVYKVVKRHLIYSCDGCQSDIAHTSPRYNCWFCAVLRGQESFDLCRACWGTGHAHPTRLVEPSTRVMLGHASACAVLTNRFECFAERPLFALQPRPGFPALGDTTSIALPSSSSLPSPSPSTTTATRGKTPHTTVTTALSDVGAQLEQQGKKKIPLSDLNFHWLSYGQVHTMAQTLSVALRSIGCIPHESFVLFTGRNSPRWMIIDYACILAGLISVPVEAAVVKHPQSLSTILAKTKPSCILSPQSLLEHFTTALRGTGFNEELQTGPKRVAKGSRRNDHLVVVVSWPDNTEVVFKAEDEKQTGEERSEQKGISPRQSVTTTSGAAGELEPLPAEVDKTYPALPYTLMSWTEALEPRHALETLRSATFPRQPGVPSRSLLFPAPLPFSLFSFLFFLFLSRLIFFCSHMSWLFSSLF